MWVYFGNKESKVEEIRSVTGIGADILVKNSPLSKYCIATGMSWAADRRATRLEDLAHSLMGIFGVNMPLLYGEGKKAFSRLQEEMIRRTTDVTFLLWGFNNMTGDLFAKRPADFRDLRARNIPLFNARLPFSLTNLGLDIDTMPVQ
jgi:hypothetical protein